jgi:hypothetical protein
MKETPRGKADPAAAGQAALAATVLPKSILRRTAPAGDTPAAGISFARQRVACG